MTVTKTAEQQEKAEQHLKFMKIDQKVYDFLGAETWQFWEQCMKQSAQDPLQSKIAEFEKVILHKEMQIDALKKENKLIWEKYVNDIAATCIEIHELHKRYKAVLDHEKSNTE